MKVLVVGATGSIGANLVKRLVEEGHEVRSQVRPQSRNLFKIEAFGTEIFPFDLSDCGDLEGLVKNVDAIFHMAMGESLQECLDVNISFTALLLEAVRKFNPDLRRFVYGSSVVLYPQMEYTSRVFRESDKSTKPVGNYAVSKLSGELFVNSYHHEHQIPTVTLMIPETYCGREIIGERACYVSPFIEDHLEILQSGWWGTSRELENCIRALQKHLKDGKQFLLPLLPEGRPWRRHLGDVRDVVSACMLAIVELRAVGETFVVMSDALDYGEGIPHLSEFTGLGYAEEIMPYGFSFWYDVKATQNILGYRPEIDSRRIMEDAWRHLHGEDIGIVEGTKFVKRRSRPLSLRA